MALIEDIRRDGRPAVRSFLLITAGTLLGLVLAAQGGPAGQDPATPAALSVQHEDWHGNVRRSGS